MHQFRRFLAFVVAPLALVAGVAGYALAQSAASSPPDAPRDLAALWPMLGLAIGNLNAYLSRRLSAAFSFFHSSTGALLLAGEGAVIAAIVPVLQAHGFVWASLAWAAVGALTSFLATLNPSTTADQPAAKSPAAAKLAALLPVIFLIGVGAVGCHGYKAPTYATLALMSQGATAATQATPPACETLENAAVDAAKSKDEAITKAAAIHERCGAALTVLDGVGKGVKTARDAVHDAPDSATLTEALPWIKVAVTSYCDAAKMLALLNVRLPIFAGVC